MWFTGRSKKASDNSLYYVLICILYNSRFRNCVERRKSMKLCISPSSCVVLTYFGTWEGLRVLPFGKLGDTGFGPVCGMEMVLYERY